MTVSERAISSALGWPTPLACLYSLAMETGIGIRDYWHEDSSIAAIVDGGQVIALSCGLADDGLRADVLAMALEVAIVMTNRPGAICAPGGFAVITPYRVPAPGQGSSPRSWPARVAGTSPPRRLSTTSPGSPAMAMNQARPAAG
jgi:hypothetical protein